MPQHWMVACLAGSLQTLCVPKCVLETITPSKRRPESELILFFPAVVFDQQDGPRMPSGDFLLCVQADISLLETEGGCGKGRGH